ncbi:hypothetical protein [Paenibacillus odorifer]|uniref:hypothetical protein n=1 Tax=Paenibacillus odorifer TaxID=189426 RepID=UPI0020C0BDE8|nr:hypothetical protein [Paenibacillus odorifer]
MKNAILESILGNSDAGVRNSAQMAINGQIAAAESVSICRALVEVGRKLVKD